MIKTTRKELEPYLLYTNTNYIRLIFFSAQHCSREVLLLFRVNTGKRRRVVDRLTRNPQFRILNYLKWGGGWGGGGWGDH